MKLHSLRSLSSICLLALFGLALHVSPTALLAQEQATPSEADREWSELETMLKPPAPPAEWRERRPSEEEIATFREQQGKRAALVATKLKEFYTKHPGHEHADEAKEYEQRMLQTAVQLGNEDAIATLDKLEAEKLKDPNLSEDDRLELRMGALQRAGLAKREEGREAVMAFYLEGARELIKEFPRREEPYQIVLQIMGVSEPDQARSLAREIVESEAPEDTKDAARAELRKLDALGRPLDIAFTALDGREVDLKNMKGKVVLVDFWATWCGPCVAELPGIKQTYQDLHEKGFEIVGISFDSDKERLEAFIKQEEMPWPQYFDGKGWENTFGQKYGINGIPAMWLVNKQGNLVDMNARANLESKVTKLLAE